MFVDLGKVQGSRPLFWIGLLSVSGDNFMTRHLNSYLKHKNG